ncbi:MAG: SPOR domain-containing protein [Betaproteobacteria bacterium]|nr:SPOR domain-containing protein [Betaproteobacteria bacterium]
MTQVSSGHRSNPRPSRNAPFLKGLLVGLVLGVALSAGVALYITRMPSPFVAHSTQSSTAPDKPIAEMPDVSRQGLMNPSPVASGAASIPSNIDLGRTGGTTSPTDLPFQTPATPSTASEPGPTPNLPEPTTTVTYFVQTGAFSKESEAENQRANLALMGVDATVLSPEVGDKPLYRVRVGPIVSVDEVRTLVATLKNNGITTNIIKLNSIKPKNAVSR